MRETGILRNGRLTRVFISVVICMVFIGIPVGKVYALPFQAPSNLPMTNAQAVAVGDFNNDGNPDLAAVSALDNNVYIRLGNGDGTFGLAVSYPTGSDPRYIAVGDLNGDGKPDLITANFNTYYGPGACDVSVLLGKGDGTFNAKVDYTVGWGPSSIAIGDFNLDGHPDLAVPNYYSNDVSILLGNGDGTFGTKEDYPAGTGSGFVAVGDFNGDSKPDLAVANRWPGITNISVLIGSGDGTFGSAVSYTAGTRPYFIAVDDFNGDGKPDLAVSNNTSNDISVFIGEGDGTFPAPVSYPAVTGPSCVITGDFNGDGKPDLATSNHGSPGVSIFPGVGDGTFGAKQDYTAGTISSVVASTDFNRDGFADLAVSNYGSSEISILLNTPEPPTITAVNPSTGLQGQALTVVITGTRFIGPASTGFGDGVIVNDVTVDNFTQVTATISIGTDASPGARNVSVTTPSGTVTLPGGFTVTAAPPTVTTVNPGRGNWGQSLHVVITGTYLSGATAVNFGTGITVNSFTVNSGTQIAADISVAPGTSPGVRDVSVTAPGGTAVLTGGFTVIPQIQSVSSGSGSSSSVVAATSTLTIIPAAISVQSASISAQTVTPGTPVIVTADIINKSAVNGSKKVVLYVNGQLETTQGVVVNRGGASQLTFNVSRSEPGDYSVYVDGVPAGNFKVEMVTLNDGLLICSSTLLALAFLIGMVMLWRRQRTSAN